MTTEPRSTAASQRRRSFWMIAVGLGVLALIAGILLSISLGQQTAAGPSSSPPASARASADATPPTTSALPSESAQPEATPIAAPAELIPMSSRVRVLATGLRMRRSASLDAPIVARLAAGEVLYVVSAGATRLPPTIADGYAWYPVQFSEGYADWPMDPPLGQAEFGFVAAHSDAGDWFVEVMDPRCPESTDIASLTAIAAWERASCMRDEQLTLEGTYGCGVCDALAQLGRWEPEWLAHYLNPMFPLSPVGRVQEVGVESIVLAFPPDARRPRAEDRGSVMRVVGHFNDPLSADCVVGDDSGLSADLASEWYCRERFVVEEWEITGTDADYPTP